MLDFNSELQFNDFKKELMLGATQQLYYKADFKVLQGGNFMGWRTVMITQHAKLSYSANMLVVQTRDGINQIPITDIDVLLIDTTQAVITTAAIAEMSKQQTKVIFTDEQHQPITETMNYYPNNRTPELLLKQVNWDQARMDILWTKIVNYKVTNQIKVLDVYDEPTNELVDELAKLELGDLTNREAVIARKYFPLLFEDKFSRRDDSAVNAALNYGYAILLSFVNKEIVSRGNVTYFGVHHHSLENQFNLGSDLMEPFRPVIDYWVAGQKFLEFTPDVKYGLVDAMNLELKYNGHKMLLRNVIPKYVQTCLDYLDGNRDNVEIEVELTNEVPHYALNGHV